MGRPSTPKKQAVTTYLPSEVREELAAEAQASNLTLAAYVALIIANRYAETENPTP